MKQLFVIIVLLGIFSSSAGRFKLHDKQLLYYEPLYYDTNDLRIQHERNSSLENTVFIRFHAYNRNFTLLLKRIYPSPKVVLRRKRETTVPDWSFIYTGKDEGYPQSDVRVSIINGTFQGKIKHSGEATYHVVPSSGLFTGSPPFHTVIYKEEHYNWTHSFHYDTSSEDGSSVKFDREKNGEREARFSRAIPRADDTILNKRVCPIKLTTDITVWKYYMKLTQNEDRAYYEILSLLQSHVDETNKVFESTVFSVNGNDITGVRLELQEIMMYQEKDCDSESNDPLCDISLTDYEELLTHFSYYKSQDYYYEDTESHCISMLITARVLYRNKEMTPILGYSNHAEEPEFGICSEFNTGYITLFRDDMTHAMPVHVSQIVFTHEVAHAFGAYHDDKEECADFNLQAEPNDGYFLMNSVVQDGSKPNNRLLSECSRSHISKILERRPECLTDGVLPYCGNGVVDYGEECDCGDRCDFDSCCHPPNATMGVRCKLKQGAECSPSQGPCCNSLTCKPRNSTENFVCQNSQECVDALYCKGEKYGAVCPEPEKHEVRADGFICNVNGRVCDHGSCKASVCRLIGWKECGVTVDSDTLTISDKEKLCYMGCQKPGTKECVNTHDTDKVEQHSDLKYLLYNISLHQETKLLSIQLPVGTPCNRNRGYCDVFKRCRGADPDSPLTKLKDCLKEGHCLKQIMSFIKVYWRAILVFSVIAIVLFFFAVRCLAVHTRSSNLYVEEKHPRRSFRQSSVILRNGMSTFRDSARNSFRRRSHFRSQESESHEVDGIPENEMILLNEETTKNDDVFT